MPELGCTNTHTHRHTNICKVREKGMCTHTYCFYIKASELCQHGQIGRLNGESREVRQSSPSDFFFFESLQRKEKRGEEERGRKRERKKTLLFIPRLSTGWRSAELRKKKGKEKHKRRKTERKCMPWWERCHTFLFHPPSHLSPQPQRRKTVAERHKAANLRSQSRPPGVHALPENRGCPL